MPMMHDKRILAHIWEDFPLEAELTRLNFYPKWPQLILNLTSSEIQFAFKKEKDRSTISNNEHLLYERITQK